MTQPTPAPDQPWRSYLQTEAARLGVPLTGPQLDDFQRYLDALLQWNRRVNLTAITEPGQVAALHFLDSLTCLAAIPFPRSAAVADVGAGAGLPGIPLAIARPDLRLTLIESVAKKCRFLEHAVATLALPAAAVYCGRAETAGRDGGLREGFDIVVTRAVAELAVAAELCLPLVKPGGAALIMKGPRPDEEIARGMTAVTTLGGSVESVRHFVIPAPDEAVGRTVVVLRKRTPTPDPYPRLAGRPAKHPLGIDRLKRPG